MAMFFDRQTAERFDDRMEQRRRVMEALGIVLPRRIDGAAQQLIRETLTTCVTCPRAHDCKAWLGTVKTAPEAPAFCPNKARFEALLEGAESHEAP